MKTGKIQFGSTLILLPHHDDEFFLGLHLKTIARSSKTVFLIYLTRDFLGNSLRSDETKKYLARAGITNAQIISLGAECGCFDGQLHLCLPAVYALLLPLFLEIRPETVIVPAWEGGHHDHDAAHYLGAILRRSLLPLSKFYQFGLYSGQNLFGPMFRISGFRRANDQLAYLIEEGSYFRRLQHALCVVSFKSQWRTFIGLWPPFLINRLLGRRMFLSEVGHDLNYFVPPHSGKLFYERRFNIPWLTFLEMLKTIK